ncbi:MAG: EamA family transporter, partial [Candidatus Heimdallarchaeota archaeon]
MTIHEMSDVFADNRVIAYIAIFIAAILWGTPYTVVKIGLSVLSPPLPAIGFLMLRFSIALLLLLPLLVISSTRHDISILLKNRFIALLGFINASAYVLQFLGQVGTTAAIATLMANMYLISTPILSSYVLREKISSRLKLALMGGLCGAIIVTMSVSNEVAKDDKLVFFLSVLLVLCSGLIWGAYAVISSIINQKSKELGIDEMANPLAVFISSNFYSVIV